jgi:putative component of membrane protein insertase Oxa1/YidC/SpoIIIJ protein YidD
MKGPMLRMIEAWQANPDRRRGLCLQTPTCSEYGRLAITRHGVVLGGARTAWRILNCSTATAVPLPARVAVRMTATENACQQQTGRK